MDIVQVREETRELSRVLELHRAAKATLGHLPDAGFTDRAVAGTLLGAVINDNLCGYLMYDLPGDQVRIRHLCVDPAVRRAGVARALIDDMAARHQDRRVASLSCRRSYGLEAMWSGLGFRPVGERAGNSLKREPLTIWKRDLADETLFTLAPVVGDVACLDQVVFEDLVVERDQGLHSRHLLEDWVAELLELCVTDEVHVESNQTDDPALRRRLLHTAESFRRLTCDPAQWEPHLPAIAALIPRAGSRDRRHVCRAIGGGAQYFVTRDAKVLEGAEGIAAGFGVLVLAPEQLLDRLDRERRQDRYEPAALQGTALVDEPLTATNSEEFIRRLLNTGAHERAHLLRRTVNRGLADPDAEVRVIRDQQHGVVAGVVRAVSEDRLKVTAVRVRRVARLTDTVARQLVFQQRLHAAQLGLVGIDVTDPNPQPAMTRALAVEGLSAGAQCSWHGTIERGITTAAEAFRHVPTPVEVAEYERHHWPVKVSGGMIETWMVAIKPTFAEQLFDTGLAEGTLFPRQQELGISRELVYYRAAGGGSKLAPPARILWYVSQGSSGHAVGQVRAVSQLAEVITARPGSLHRRYARLGVWTQEQVEKTAGRRGLAMALRVTDTELMQRPISRPELVAMYAAEGRKFSPPLAPIRVHEHMFCLIYRRGSAYA